MKVGRYGAMLIAALLLGEMCITPKLDSFAAQEKTDICEDISEESDIVTEVNSAEALNDMLADSWYEDISGADSIDEEESFALKRLILYADSLYDTYGAENILCYDEYDEYILEFDSEEETEAAYYEIGRDYGFDNCFPDQLIDCDNMYSYEELYPYTTSDELDNLEVGSYDTWGASYMGLDYLKAEASYFDFAEDIEVAIIDSGIYEGHSKFDGRIDYEKSLYIFKENGEATSSDALEDTMGHGTHVAGIIADCTPENVSLMIIKTFVDGKSTQLAITTALQYAIEMDADVINMSLGWYSESAAGYKFLDSIIEKACDKSIPISVAAGNYSQDVSYAYPANNSNVFTVSAIKSDGTFDSSYSNYGDSIDFAAPGTRIYNTYKNGLMAYSNGTSMAAPHISGALVYIKMAEPELSISEIEERLKEYAVDLGDAGWDEYYGYGVVNLKEYFNDLCKKSISDMTLVLDDTSYVYTGNQIQPAVTVLDENKEELSSDNYYVKYDCNVDIGTGTVTVTGTGNYKGELTGTFYIVPGDGKIVSLANGKTGITIRWDSVPGATGYRVYRKTYSGSWIRIAVLSGNDALSYVDTGAASGTIYYYIVRPEASNILGGFANYMKIQRLAQPVFSRANTATGINISWSAVKGAKGYKIYRKVNNQTGWTLIKTVSASTLYYNDTAVTTGNKYTYTVKAYSGSYNSSWHKGAVMYRHAGRNIYYAKSPKAGQLFLKWYGDNKVTGYQVSYSTDSTFSSFKYVTVKGNSINYKTLTGLSKGKYYYVKVRSYRVVDGVTYCSNWGAVKKIYISK